MIIDTGTMLGIIIALLGSSAMMILFWRENMALRNIIKELQVALRDERRK